MMKTFLFSLAVAVGVTGTATAQGMSLGQFEFENSCAICHGLSGKGDGEFAQALTVRPANLTMLQKENGGVFPVQSMYATIDGSDILKAHGTRDMPIWGKRYLERTAASTDYPFSAEESSEYAHGRILALIEYISTLQAK